MPIYELSACDLCERELQPDERLKAVPGFDDRVCPECFDLIQNTPKEDSHASEPHSWEVL